MKECLYTGQVAAAEIPRIVAACHFVPEARFLAEQLPNRFIGSAQEGRDLLCFTYFAESLAHACARYTSGRIFQKDRELRWERQGQRLNVVYLGPEDEGVLADALRPRDTLTTLTKKTAYYYLFGERLKPEDLAKLDKIARPGDFAVVRIPRILRYPVEQNDRPYARLVVCEYLDAASVVTLFRFQHLETVN